MNDDPTLFADGFDDAIIGLNYKGGHHRVVYDGKKMVEELEKKEGWTEEEAMEWLQFNTFNAFYGKGTPIYVDVMTRAEIEHFLENNDE